MSSTQFKLIKVVRYITYLLKKIVYFSVCKTDYIDAEADIVGILMKKGR